MLLPSIVAVRLDGSGTAPQTRPGITFPAAATVTLPVVVQGQNGSPVNLTGCALVLSIKDKIGGTLLLSHQAVIDSPGIGTAHFTILSTDTLGLRGSYVYEIEFIDASNNNEPVVPVSPVFILDSLYTPGQLISVLTSSLPIGVGPPGFGQVQSPIGTNLSQRPIVTFDGTLIKATDNSGNNSTDVTLAPQLANRILAGPASGPSGAVTARALVLADLPTNIPNANLQSTTIGVVAGAGLTGGGAGTLGGSAPALAVVYGTAANTATVGNDVRLPPAPSGAGKLIFDTGTAYSTLTAGTANQVLIGGATPSFGLVPTTALPTVGTAGTYGDAKTQFIGELITDIYGRVTSVITHARAWVNVKDYGAKGDGVTNDRTAIQSAIDAVATAGGGVVYFPIGQYAIATGLVLSNLSGRRYDNVVLMGEGYGSHIFPQAPIIGGGAGGTLYVRGNNTNYDLKNFGLYRLRFSGYDETTTGTSPVVAFYETDTTFVVDCFFDTNCDEGLYFNSPADSQNVYVANCHFNRVGGWGSTKTNDARSAININAHNSVVVGCKVSQVGFFVEQTGSGGCWVGNIFEYGALQGDGGSPIYQVGMVFESPGSATGQNGRLVIANNTVRYAGTAIGLGSQSTQSIIIAHNSIEFCNNGISVGSAVGPVLVEGNYFFDTIPSGLSQGFVLGCSGAGGALFRGNVVVTGATPWAYIYRCSDTTTQAIVRDTTVYGNAVTSVMYCMDVANAHIEFFNNDVIDYSNSIPSARVYYRWNPSGSSADLTRSLFAGINRGVVLSTVAASVIYASTAPTAGTWKIGDRCINTAPTATGVYQWLCTTAGTPGTWTPQYTFTDTGIYNVKSFGAKGDGIADDTAAIQAAIDSVRDTGGVVLFPNGTYLVSSTLQIKQTASHNYFNIELRGDGYQSHIKPSVALGPSGGGNGVINFHGLSAYSMINCGIRNLRVSGFDETTNAVGPVVSWGNTSGGYAIDCWIDTNRNEGLYWATPTNDQNAYVSNVYITRVGGWGSTDLTDSRAAFNLNANNIWIVDCHSFQCGQAVEQTGIGGVISDSVFEYCANNGGAASPSYVTALSLASTTGTGKLIVSRNTIRYANAGISWSGSNSGEAAALENLIEFCNTGITLLSSTTPSIARGNYIFDTTPTGNSQGAAIQISGAGGGTVEYNHIVAGAVQWAEAIYVSDATCPAIVRGNIVYGDAVTTTVFLTNASNTVAEWLDNTVIPGSMPATRVRYQWQGTSFSQSSYSGIDKGTVLSTVRPSLVRSTAAPTSGAWRVEDEFKNTALSATGVYKWVCTTAGTPGTWTPEYVAYTNGAGLLLSASQFAIDYTQSPTWTGLHTFAPTNTSGAALTVAPVAAASGVQGSLTVTAPASTNQTASTEVNGILFDMSATRQWATGALPLQREVYLKSPTYAFVAASTLTKAATLAVGRPFAGANATILNAIPVLVQNDNIGTSISGSVAHGVSLQNTTAAAAGAQQNSPLLELVGQGWKTNATAASQTVAVALQAVPTQGAASPTVNLYFAQNINNTGYVYGPGITGTGYFCTAGDGLDIAPNTSGSLVLGGAWATSIQIGRAGTTTVTIKNGQVVTRVGKAISYTVTTSDYLVAATAASITLTMPAAGLVNGQTWVLKDESGSGTTVSPNGKTIDGTSGNKTLAAYAVLRLYTDGSNYFTC